MVPLKFTILNAAQADNDIVNNVSGTLAKEEQPGPGRNRIFLENYVRYFLPAAGCDAPVHRAGALC